MSENSDFGFHKFHYNNKWICALHVNMCSLYGAIYYNYGTGYDYPDLPGLGNNNEKLGLPERLSTGIQFRFRNLFHGKKSGNRNFIC